MMCSRNPCLDTSSGASEALRLTRRTPTVR